MDNELNEENLDKIIGGISFKDVVEIQKDAEKDGILRRKDELFEDDLDKVTAGKTIPDLIPGPDMLESTPSIPEMPDLPNEIDEPFSINEFGEIIRGEGRSK